ncbi:hypothetical protein CO2235_230251 [Cupriavidus oxalaticus]|uniref:Uncharacterized protein n=1 Tax=Cupriavidus oxalaticus TaxID=96344 RepID=A0A375G2Z8_9BURK|nr:hypothetical protein CO2235_230251 [Cupriavidus oxalaticus]
MLETALVGVNALSIIDFDRQTEKVPGESLPKHF